MSDTLIATARASSVGEFFDCAHRWESKYILGKFLPSSGAAHLGTSLHAGTAAFDGAKLNGSPITVDDAAGVLIDTLHHPKEEVDWADEGPSKVEAVALKLHTRYCNEIAPRREYSGVEVKYEALDLTVPDVGTIRLTGTTDRVRKTAKGHGISDLKSGKTAVSADGTVKIAGHALQMGVYELLAEHAMGVVITDPAEVVGLCTVKDARVGAGSVDRPRDVLIGTDEEPGALETMGRMLKAGLFPGNAKSMLCSAKFCPVYPCRWVR